MTKLALLYAEADGAAAAARLGDLLATLDYTVQPPTAAMAADAVLALLTPAATTDRHVRANLRDMAAAGRAPITLPVDPQTFPTAADLADLLQQLARPTATDGSDQYIVLGGSHNAIGRGAIAVNPGAGGLDAQATAQLIAQLRRAGDGAPLAAAELRAALYALHGEIGALQADVTGLRAELLARFDRSEQAVIGAIGARLDAQHLATLDAILDAVEINALAADELDYHLDAIAAVVAELRAHAIASSDRQVAAEAAAALRLAEEPGLSAKHKLEVTLPLIPLLVDYKFELELDSKANLVQLWAALKRRVQNLP
ncbi:MAG: hypothetical protein KAX65_03395 [Caldilineaceae bacterium]|nr:hypothetical protein [Caldilineaceae bacterium]